MQRSKTYRVTWLKIVLALSSVASLVMLLMAAFEENFTAKWRTHQQDYAQVLSKTSHDAATRSAEYPLEIRQAYLEEWDTQI